ncbi:AraC family two component transcriptional regulator [Kineothrix alysoides]|uniref:Stage 0 sporulation protein A homolog n=1 Tax=Kineothrix alysoides TaxID=1469948 RepID=A0A4R1R695_9FIRM|nr:response regulator [Kineothrix alysoides]TCL61086.1 AraC family two component transcriptional regulator [Kineothrix alysoides]
MLYRVMLVDDEEEVIQAILQKIDWEVLGFQVVGYAKNGQDALEMLETLETDVIMTDIKMPFMDGITLCKKVKEQYGNIHILIFSGFDEFEYAREAIKAEVEEYILKPTNAKELAEVFLRLKNSIDKERRESTDIQKLKEYYMESLPVMQKQYMISLIEGKLSDGQIQAYLDMYQLNLSSPFYTVAVVHANNPEMPEEGKEPLEKQLLPVSAKKYVDEKLEGKWQFESFVYFGKIVYIVMLEQSEDLSAFIDFMGRICKMTERTISVSLLAGIGQMHNQLSLLPHSYESASAAISYRGLNKGSCSVYIGEVDPNLNSTPIIDMEGVQEIIQQIKFGREKELEEAIAHFMIRLKRMELTYQQLQIVSMEVVTELYKLGGSYQLDMHKILKTGTYTFSDIEEMNTVERLEGVLRSVCFTVLSLIRKERKDSTKLLIEKAKDYIQNNYSDSECTVESVCSHLNISTCYFSTLFKREVGLTLINYMTDIRMEKAKELLKNTEDKTYVIAEKVGYAEPNYFSYVFKKKFKVSPSLYRVNGVG